MVGRRREFTVAEAAGIAGVSPITIRVWIVRGYLRRNAHGKIDGEQLVAYVDEPRRARHDPRADPPQLDAQVTD